MEYIVQIKPTSLDEMKIILSTYGDIKKIINIGKTFTSLLINFHSSDISILEKMPNIISISQNSKFHTM